MQCTCPQCHTVFPINLEQLRSARGTVQCGQCQLKFNSLSTLSESSDGLLPPSNIVASSIPLLQVPEEIPCTPDEEPAIEPQPSEEPVVEAVSTEEPQLTAPWETGKPSAGWIGQLSWLLASIATFLLFGYQFYLNEVKYEFPNQTARTFFELGCEKIHCKLPPLKAVSKIDVVDRSIQPKKNALLLKITLANHALHEQPFPKLKLTLSDFRNNPIAERIFSRSEYLPKADKNGLMPVDQPISIQLTIAPLKEKVETFSFELL